MKELHIIGILIIFLFPLLVGILFGISSFFIKDVEKKGVYLYPLFLFAFFLIIFFISLYTDLIKKIGLSLPNSFFQCIFLGVMILVGIGLYYFELFGNVVWDKIKQICPLKKNKPASREIKIFNMFRSINFQVLLFLSLIISFCEEFLWRGFLMTTLKINFLLPNWINVLLSSILFGINHYYFGLRVVIFKFLSGIIFGVLYIFTKNILFPFIAHLSFNIYYFWRRIKLSDEKILFQYSFKKYMEP